MTALLLGLLWLLGGVLVGAALYCLTRERR